MIVQRNQKCACDPKPVGERIPEKGESSRLKDGIRSARGAYSRVTCEQGHALVTKRMVRRRLGQI